MEIGELKESLLEILNDSDQNEEDAHIAADDLLLEYINDQEVSNIYKRIPKFYA